MNDIAFSKIKRRYFEVFGDLEVEIRFLRKLTLILSGVVVLLVFFVFLLSRRPPVVIRVSEVEGAQAIADLRSNNEPTRFEILSFAKHFTTNYTAYNSYTLSRDMSIAFNRMAPTLQKQARKQIVESGLLQKIAEAGIDTEIEFKEERLERNSEDAAVVSLVGVRRITQYARSDFRDETLFRAELVLKKVPRTREAPEGLLVEAYREMTLNELTERK